MRFTSEPPRAGPAGDWPKADSIAAPVSRSAGAPTSTLVMSPRAARASTTVATYSGGHRFAAPNAAPGANPTSVAPGATPRPDSNASAAAAARGSRHQAARAAPAARSRHGSRANGRGPGSNPHGAHPPAARLPPGHAARQQQAAAVCPIPPPLRHAARAIIQADPNEFVRRSTRSKRPARTRATSPANARTPRLAARTERHHLVHALDHRGDGERSRLARRRQGDPLSDHSRSARHAGSAMTTSPSQLGKRTSVREGMGLRASLTRCSLSASGPSPAASARVLFAATSPFGLTLTAARSGRLTRCQARPRSSRAGCAASLPRVPRLDRGGSPESRPAPGPRPPAGRSSRTLRASTGPGTRGRWTIGHGQRAVQSLPPPPSRPGRHSRAGRSPGDISSSSRQRLCIQSHKCGLAPHVHLEHVGAALRELARRLGRVVSRRVHRVLVDQPVAAVAKGSANTGRRPRRSGSRAPPPPTWSRRGARRSRPAPHPRPGCAGRSAAPRPCCRAAPAGCGEPAAPVDHAVAGGRAHPFEQVVQQRVVERTRDDGDVPRAPARVPARGSPRTRSGPVMNRAPAPGRAAPAARARRRRRRPVSRSLLVRQPAQAQHLHQHAPEVAEHAPRRRADLACRRGAGTPRTGWPGQAPMPAVDRVEREAEQVARRGR